MGCIVATHPGVESVTRVVTVKMRNTTFKSPTSKVFPLPIGDAGIELSDLNIASLSGLNIAPTLNEPAPAVPRPN